MQERVGCLAKSTLQKWKSEMLGQWEQGNLLVFCKDLSQNCLSVSCRVCHQFDYVWWSLSLCISGCHLKKTRGPGVVSKNYWVYSYFPFQKLSCVVNFITAIKPTQVIRTSRPLLIHKPDKKGKSSASLFKLLYILKILNWNFLPAWKNNSVFS